MRAAAGWMLLVHLVSPSASSLIQIPMRRHAVSSVPASDIVLSGVSLRGSSARGDPGDFDLDLTAVQGVYVIDLAVGTPSQLLPVILDMRGPYMVATVKSSSSPSFDPAMSTSIQVLQQDMTVETSHGSISADIYKDVVDGFEGFSFLGTDKHIVNMTQVGGVIGLSPSDGSVIPSVLQQLATFMGGEKPVFAFHMPRGQSSSGELVVGGVNTSHYTGDFNFLPLVSPGLWVVAMDKLFFGDESYTSTVNLTFMHPSHLLSGGPVSAVKSMAESMGGATLHPSGLYSVDCGADPTLTLTLGGTEYTLGREELILELAPGDCIFTVAPLAGAAERRIWVLGWTFLEKYYVQFDAAGQRLGVALAA